MFEPIGDAAARVVKDLEHKMSDKKSSLFILSLQVENVLRAVAVYIKPNGKVVELTGRNKQGKTSVLEALWMALGGERAIPAMPIHDGADAGFIIVEIGDASGVAYKITRRLKAREGGGYTTTLIVENADGSRFQKPQDMLNALVGSLSCDPLEFLRKSEKDRFDLLKQFVTDVDLDIVDQEIRVNFDRRTLVNRRVKELRAQAAGVIVPENAPTKRIDESELVAQMEKAAAGNVEIVNLRSAREKAAAEINTMVDRAKTMKVRAADLRRQADAVEAESTELMDVAGAAQKKLDDAPVPPNPVDVSLLRQQIADARAANDILARVERRQEIIADAEMAESEADSLSAAIEELKAKKQQAVATAKMPVEGITFGDGVVLFDGFPLSQASGAQQLRLSVGIAASLNPRLRFVRIKDASLLDQESWEALEHLAEEMNLQVFAETVQSNRPTAVIIEDGHVKAPALEAAE
jgi:hypothetical protein